MRILFCGQSSYPNNNNAPTNRYIAIAKVMSFENEIIFINRIPLLKKSFFLGDAEFNVIDVSGQKYRPDGFVKRSLIKLLSPFYEFLTIRKLNREKKVEWINIYTQFFGLCLFYYFLSKIFNFKTILHYVEIRSQIKGRNFFLRCNDYLYDNYVMFLFDRYIPISHFLDNHLKDKKEKVSTLIIPPICDFQFFKTIDSSNQNHQPYLLYCGSAAYSEVILFIIESFKKIKSDHTINLHLVLNGLKSEHLKNLLEQNKDRIKVFSNLEYTDLIRLYKNSLALLIPLRNIEQDLARFPQKIAEYIAAEKIIISTNFGEVQHYFQDLNNAVLADKYDTESYSDKMDWVITNKLNLSDLEFNAYETGKKYFDIIAYQKRVALFLK